MHEKGYLSMDKFSKPNKTEEAFVELVKNPEVIDDYIRNFLSAKGLTKTLDSFQVNSN
jgi:predicted xylose isomerase-like sugar epimerase